MNSVFLDTVGLIAAVNADDQWHVAAHSAWRRLLIEPKALFTTNLILVEIGDGLSKVLQRPLAVELRRRLTASPRVEIVRVTEVQESKAWELFEQRADKNWGITDCVSMIVMEERGCRAIFSIDHHFEQAGFELLISRVAPGGDGP